MQRTLKILALIGAILVMAFFLVAWRFNAILDPSTDIDDYQTALESMPTELVEHFPKAASKGSKTRFHYRPGFLQGGTTVQLGLKANTSSVEKVRSQYKAKAVEHWRGCVRNSTSDFMPRRQKLGASADPACDYDVYILQATPGEEWNHGHEAGIAASETRQEILYWATDW